MNNTQVKILVCYDIIYNITVLIVTVIENEARGQMQQSPWPMWLSPLSVNKESLI